MPKNTPVEPIEPTAAPPPAVEAASALQPVAIPTYHCRRCEHTWIPPKPEPPKKCPACQTRLWGREALPQGRPPSPSKGDGC